MRGGEWWCGKIVEDFRFCCGVEKIPRELCGKPCKIGLFLWKKYWANECFGVVFSF